MYFYRGYTKDRNDAFLKGFQVYCYRLENYHPDVDGPKMPTKQRNKLEAQLMERYKLAREEGLVTINYTCPSSYIGTSQQELEVGCHRKQKFGHVSHFQVVKNTFNASVVNVDEPVRDPDFWRIMHAHKLKIGLQAESESEYIALNIDKRVLCPSDYKRPIELGVKPDYFTIRKILTPYGIIGLEYYGGTYSGGKGMHRAFCIWDEDFVNQSKVGMLR